MKIKLLLMLIGFALFFSAGIVKAEYSANIIPAMTTNLLPSGVITVSTGLGSMVSAFDHTVSTWIADPGLPQWVGYQFTDSNPVRVAKYAITSMAPKSWEFQGSINGADWVVLDSRSDVVFSDFQLQEFVVATPENYFFYKLHITAIANEFSSVGVSELEMFIDNSFVVLAPTVATVAASDVTQTSAMVNAELLDSGGENTTRLIHQWVNEPIEANLWNTDGPPGTGPAGVYSAEMTGLTPDTTYYFQAYAYNSAGSSYGEILSFTTEAVPAPPIVVTNAVSDITQTSATANGDMTFRGNPFIPSRTISWGTESGNYTGSCNLGMGVEGAFSCPMAGLSPDTIYYVQAYASGGAGIGYGEEVSFTTLPIPDTIGPDAPIANVESGTYFSAQTITLIPPVGDDVIPTIYYTIDGTEPDNTSDQVTGPIVIDGDDGQTKVLKAVSYDTTENKGTIMTQSYVFDKSATIIDPNIEKMAAAALNGHISIAGIDPTNTANATFNVDYTLQSGAALVFFPAGTIITKTGGGNLDLTQLTTQDITLSLNSELTNDAFGAVKIGVPNIRLTFSTPVTVTIPVGAQYNGLTLNVYYQFDGDSSWNLETTCTVSSGVCSFQTTHATKFSAGESVPSDAAVITAKESHGKNWRIYKKYKRTHNLAVARKPYAQIKKIKKIDAGEFERLKKLYATYRVAGSRAIAKLDKKTQADFNLYRKYRIYKQYLILKDRAGE
ncbi:MAG: hypothetical protein US10_C0006G0013 [Candidatus Moranbacteria bacterium GW2011_GWD2_36_198]|nr:MAG: hypothetical protein US10_C0006G0013 [Candidatus Moranbacteria bacterium GW2011_GWD2_36_198]